MDAVPGIDCHAAGAARNDVPRINAIVNTPNGQGVVQGRMRDVDGNLRVLVAHDRNPSRPHTLVVVGLWKLMEYEVELVQAV